MAHTKEQILETFKKLPEDIRETMFSVDTAMVIQDIRQKYKLTIDKMGELADETGLIMLGFTHPKDYIHHLTERLGVNREIAKEIAEEVNSRIFFSVREQLKKIHGLEQEPPTKDGPLQDFQKGRSLEIPEATEPAEANPLQNIFEARTKEEIFRIPKTVSEKTEPPKFPAKLDPYREQI